MTIFKTVNDQQVFETVSEQAKKLWVMVNNRQLDLSIMASSDTKEAFLDDYIISFHNIDDLTNEHMKVINFKAMLEKYSQCDFKDHFYIDFMGQYREAQRVFESLLKWDNTEWLKIEHHFYYQPDNTPCPKKPTS